MPETKTCPLCGKDYLAKYPDCPECETTPFTTIKKISEGTTYSKTVKETTFKVNGKTVKVYETNEWGDDIQPDCDTEIDQNDLNALTDIEHETFGEQLGDWLAMEAGKEEIIKLNE